MAWCGSVGHLELVRSASWPLYPWMLSRGEYWFLLKLKSLNQILLLLIVLKHYIKKLRILTSWCGHDQLIESEAFSTCFDDSCSSGLSESESSNCHLWYIKKSIVISDSANNDGDFVSKRLNISIFIFYLLSLQKLGNLGE